MLNMPGTSLRKGQKNKPSKKKKPKKRPEINLLLEKYDFLFSDFDSRPYDERSLSDDFLHEAKKVFREKKSGKLELKFQVPARIRRKKVEEIIEKRLHSFFRSHYNSIRKEIFHLRRKGSLMAFLGASLLVVSAYISLVKKDDFVFHLLKPVLEPGGWFLTWTGLDEIFYLPGTMKSDLTFFKRMLDCEIIFESL